MFFSTYSWVMILNNTTVCNASDIMVFKMRECISLFIVFLFRVAIDQDEFESTCVDVV